MHTILDLFFDFLLVGFFLYLKVGPYRDRLYPRYQSLFRFLHSVFHPLLQGLGSFLKPFRIGYNLSLDLSQLVLFLILLLFTQIF